MPTVAEQLRSAREDRNLTVYQVAEVTKIRTDHIRALEEGNFDVFTAPVYIRGFVRTYATLLKLDVAEVMGLLDRELGRTEKFSEPPPLTDGPKGFVDFLMLQLSRINWRVGLAVLGILIVGGVVFSGILVWRHYKTSDPLKNLGEGLYQPQGSGSGEKLPLPPVSP